MHPLIFLLHLGGCTLRPFNYALYKQCFDWYAMPPSSYDHQPTRCSHLSLRFTKHRHQQSADATPYSE